VPIINWDLNNVRASKAQIEYIECLAIDLCLDRERRNSHVSTIIARKIEYLDQLTKSEASTVIEHFKLWKEKERER
jgi:predicted LPLAT superfamily acyltransferase